MAAVLFVVTVPKAQEILQIVADEYEDVTEISERDLKEVVENGATYGEVVECNKSGTTKSQRRDPHLGPVLTPAVVAAALRSERNGKAPKSAFEVFKQASIDQETDGKENYPGKHDTSRKLAIRQQNSTEVEGESEKSCVPFVDFLEYVPLEHLLEGSLIDLGIDNATWVASKDGGHFQVTFPCEGGEFCEKVLNQLTSLGIGTSSSSIINVLPCSICIHADQEEEFDANDSDDDDGTEPFETGQNAEDESEKVPEKSNFQKSIKSRLTVAQVVELVRAQASLTFDYVVLITLASVIAAMGLAENSSVVLVASMLISPLMGPILGGTFGTTIQDGKLRNAGITTGLLGLALCIGVGFLFGLLFSGFSESWNNALIWPTDEMRNRGLLRSLWSGAMIALPSGAGVALSVLGGNMGSLVGVAISASLLPPAVNAGFLWAYAIVKSLTGINYPDALNPPHKIIQGAVVVYEPAYSDYMPHETVLLGLVSLVLTILNILCIFVMAIAVFKIKEVAPRTSTAAVMQFWKRDVPIARSYNKTLKRSDAKDFGKRFIEEWSALSQSKRTKKDSDKMEQVTFKNLVEDVENDDMYKTVLSSVYGHGRVEPLSEVVEKQSCGFDQRQPQQQYTFVSPPKHLLEAESDLHKRPTGKQRSAINDVQTFMMLPVPPYQQPQRRVSRFLITPVGAAPVGRQKRRTKLHSFTPTVKTINEQTDRPSLLETLETDKMLHSEITV